MGLEISHAPLFGGSATMSRVVRFHEYGGPEKLQIDQLDVGSPGEGEVRLRVEAIGLNRAEAMYRAGTYMKAAKLPSYIGYEGVGTIEAVGAGVKGVTVGDRVCVLPSYRIGEYGLWADHAIVPARSLTAPPPGLGVVEAASIWMQYFTALAIYEAAHATVGDTVLIRAASSSVGLAAIQLANWAGAVPVALTRTSAKAGELRKLGAKHVIATENSDLVQEVHRITGGKGARIVFDPVGGPEVEVLAQAAAEEGIIILYGGLSGKPTPYPHWTAALKGLSVRGWVASAIWNKPARFARYRDLILSGLAAGQLRPIISKTFPLDQIVEANRYLESNQQIGKVVVTVS
jgi:NADPH:quinone reductase-like Zn-dependent oxidoreductase